MTDIRSQPGGIQAAPPYDRHAVALLLIGLGWTPRFVLSTPSDRTF